MGMMMGTTTTTTTTTTDPAEVGRAAMVEAIVAAGISEAPSNCEHNKVVDGTKVTKPDEVVTYGQSKAIYWSLGWSIPKDAECRVTTGRGYRLLASRIISLAKGGDVPAAYRLMKELPGVVRTKRADNLLEGRKPKAAKPKAKAKAKAKAKPVVVAPKPVVAERMDVAAEQWTASYAGVPVGTVAVAEDPFAGMGL